MGERRTIIQRRGVANEPARGESFSFNPRTTRLARSWSCPMNSPQPYLTVASILSGFGISVFMFRIQRELGVRDRHPEWPNWLAWADYLVLAAIVLSLSLVMVPLVAFPAPSRFVFSLAAASC